MSRNGRWPDFDPSDRRVWPRYCCAILRDDEGRYLLERRAAHDPEVPNQIVCFGGGREIDEHPDDCMRRELREELGWETGALELCVRLLRPQGESTPSQREVAWFYRGRVPAGKVFQTEPGVDAVWLTVAELTRHPIGDWNLSALLAELEGSNIAWTNIPKREGR